MRLIDADSLADHVRFAYEDAWPTTTEEMANFAYDEVPKIFEREPTVNADVKTQGTWVNTDSTYSTFKCSVCEWRNLSFELKYCPNCGAKMSVNPWLKQALS